MAHAPLDCPGSWLPLAYVQPGERIVCPVCGRQLHAATPPVDEAHDPWRGSTDP